MTPAPHLMEAPDRLGARALLNDGQRIPWLGLGVFQAKPGPETYDAVRAALDLGYRHVDTASAYGNEADVGRAVRDSRLPREEVFVTTKLWNADQGYYSTQKACETSLKRLGMDYLDLYLIHWPEPGKRVESWLALVRLKDEGKCRSIGVSNFTPRHLEHLEQHAGVVPAVNQVEMSPFLFQRDVLDYCASRGILVEAYSPLAKGRRLTHPELAAVAERHGRTPAQVLIRWALEHQMVALPKSVTPERIAENAQALDFQLDTADMARLDGLDDGFRTSWDPSGVP